MHPKSIAPNPNPSGLCLCGCGQRTKIADASDRTRGYVKGCPRLFVVGHRYRRGPFSGAEPPYLIDAETGCHVWRFARDDRGYGHFRNNGVLVRAHRHFYELAKGPIPDGLVLDHLCRNPSCVNPDHLEPVTRAENARRGARAKLTARHAQAMRALEGLFPAERVAHLFEVHPSTVRGVWRGRSWDDA